MAKKDWYQFLVARGSAVKKARCPKCMKCLVFMDWQGMLKLCFILFLRAADSQIPLHIGNIDHYDNTERFESAIGMLRQIAAFYSQKVLVFVQELTLGLHFKIPRKYNWVINVVWRLWILKILANFLSYFWLDNRFQENICHIKMMLIHYTLN